MTRRHKIVVVEDDDQFRAVLIKRLESNNYEVAAAADGLSGWELIRKLCPDLIVSDLMMPGLDGQQLCHRVKTDPKLEHIYFMMLTARDSIDDCVAGFEIGADDYLSKPVNNRELMARIRAGIRISSLYNQVKSSERRYRTLIENASDAILQFNSTGLCVEANERACQMLGYSKDELLSLSFSALLPSNKRVQAQDQFALMFRIGNFIEEMMMERKDGIILPVESATTLIDTDAGAVCQCIVRDLTRRKEVEQQLIQVEKLKALGGMVGGIAHDFNNLLAAILGYTELAQRDSKDEVTQRRLKVIEKAAKDGAEIVRLLQEFTKIRKDSKQESINVNKLVDQVLLLTRHRWKDSAQAKGISIKIETDYGQISDIRGNIAELREALTNIIFNAIEALPSDGVITCRTYTNGITANISIEDSGSGMSDDIRQKIFDPFFTTKGPSFSGLGLSVCYGIVRRHSGEIAVESSLGNGTTVTIKLPFAAQTEADTKTTTPAKTVKQKRILVIDDEMVVRGVIQEILQDEGYQVVDAATGEDGIILFNKEHFDLVITDLGMPVMSGWDVTQILKSINQEVPVILLTGWATQTDLVKAKESGVDMVLGKPISSNDLVEAVLQILKKN